MGQAVRSLATTDPVLAQELLESANKTFHLATFTTACSREWPLKPLDPNRGPHLAHHDEHTKKLLDKNGKLKPFKPSPEHARQLPKIPRGRDMKPSGLDGKERPDYDEINRKWNSFYGKPQSARSGFSRNEKEGRTTSRPSVHDGLASRASNHVELPSDDRDTSPIAAFNENKKAGRGIASTNDAELGPPLHLSVADGSTLLEPKVLFQGHARLKTAVKGEWKTHCEGQLIVTKTGESKGKLEIRPNGYRTAFAVGFGLGMPFKKISSGSASRNLHANQG